jgi:hypothetical protein
MCKVLLNFPTVYRNKQIKFLKKRHRDFETGMAGKAELGPGKQTAKTWFGLEN